MKLYIQENTYIPKSWILAVLQNTQSNPPLGQLVPGGTNSAAKKRIENAKRWSGRGKLDEGNVVELEALPNTDYKIKGYAWHGYKGKMIGLEDPNKAHLCISEDNLLYIIERCNIKRGVILDEMQWVRSGRDNILLPTDSNLFLKAIGNPRR